MPQTDPEKQDMDKSGFDMPKAEPDAGRSAFSAGTTAVPSSTILAAQSGAQKYDMDSDEEMNSTDAVQHNTPEKR